MFRLLGMDTILPNTEPYVPQINKKTTVVCGEPIDFDQIVKDLKAANKTPVSYIYIFIGNGCPINNENRLKNRIE